MGNLLGNFSEPIIANPRAQGPRSNLEGLFKLHNVNQNYIDALGDTLKKVQREAVLLITSSQKSFDCDCDYFNLPPRNSRNFANFMISLMHVGETCSKFTASLIPLLKEEIKNSDKYNESTNKRKRSLLNENETVFQKNLDAKLREILDHKTYLIITTLHKIRQKLHHIDVCTILDKEGINQLNIIKKGIELLFKHNDSKNLENIAINLGIQRDKLIELKIQSNTAKILNELLNRLNIEFNEIEEISVYSDLQKINSLEFLIISLGNISTKLSQNIRKNKDCANLSDTFASMDYLYDRLGFYRNALAHNTLNNTNQINGKTEKLQFIEEACHSICHGKVRTSIKGIDKYIPVYPDAKTELSILQNHKAGNLVYQNISIYLKNTLELTSPEEDIENISIPIKLFFNSIIRNIKAQSSFLIFPESQRILSQLKIFQKQTKSDIKKTPKYLKQYKEARYKDISRLASFASRIGRTPHSNSLEIY